MKKALVSDFPFGLMLSGGLDSSLVASMAQREIERLNMPPLRSFSIGFPGSPDGKAAQEVADFSDTKHYSMQLNIKDGLEALQDVIYHVETYDVTTIRSAIPMYLLSRKVKATGIKMLLGGDGADGPFGGYLYFHAAPSKEALFKETVRCATSTHLVDGMRANKATSAWGLQLRASCSDIEVRLDLFVAFSTLCETSVANKIRSSVVPRDCPEY